jgi:putative restriction endonuclease
MPNYWMVVQSRSYKDEIPGGFLWAPISNKIGSKLPTYSSMKDVKKGDIIFSLVNPGDGLSLYATGICIEEYKDCDNPLLNNKDDWIKDGWIVKVVFNELDKKHKIRDHNDKIQPLLPTYSSPLRKNGEAAFSCYLHKISEDLANLCKTIIGNEYVIDPVSEEELEEGIRGRTDIGYTTKSQLVNSRRGQGTFKDNVFNNEKCCRITGISNPRFLIVSHIKPWAKSTDEEKLDGCNGLLLTPNADRLFDRGIISFVSDGTIMVSSLIHDDDLIALGIYRHKNVGKFSKKQCVYLDYHQKNVFKK